MNSKLTVESRREGETLVVALTGRLDILGKAMFIEAAKSFDFAGARTLRIDLAGVKYISSAGIQAILQHYKYMITNKGRVAIVNAHPEVLNVLTMSGFAKFPNLTLAGSPGQ